MAPPIQPSQVGDCGGAETLHDVHPAARPQALDGHETARNPEAHWGVAPELAALEDFRQVGELGGEAGRGGRPWAFPGKKPDRHGHRRGGPGQAETDFAPAGDFQRQFQGLAAASAPSPPEAMIQPSSTPAGRLETIARRP